MRSVIIFVGKDAYRSKPLLPSNLKGPGGTCLIVPGRPRWYVFDRPLEELLAVVSARLEPRLLVVFDQPETYSQLGIGRVGWKWL